MKARYKRALPHLPVVLILIFFSVVLTWPLAIKANDTLVSWGDPVFQMWTIAWNWHALTTDPLDIFNANVFYPWRNVLAYSDHLFGQTLMVLPVLALTDNDILADNVAFFLSFLLSGLALYWLVYDLTTNRGAAILAAVAFSFAPPRMAHFEHLHIIAAQWLPIALLCLYKVTQQRGRSQRIWAVALGLTFFAQGLFGVYFFYFMIAMLLMAGGSLLLVALYDRDREALKGLAMGVAACAVAGALLIPTLWPYQVVHQDLGIEREPSEVNFWSANRMDYLAAWPDNTIWGNLLASNHVDIERDLFPGLLVIIFGAIGLANARGGRMRLVLLAVLAGSIILSFGLTATAFGHEFPMPYRIFYDLIPGFKAIRVPARFGHLALVALAALAGLGVDLLWRKLQPRLPQRSTAFAAVGVGLILIGAETWTSLPLPDPLPTGNPRADYAYIADNPAPTIELPMGDGPVASAWPNFWSTKHWNQVANGYSGLVPPTYDLLRERSKEFPAPDVVALFQGIGIEHVIVHADMQADQRAELERALDENPAIQLVLPGPDAVYNLAPDPWIWDLANAVPDGETVDLPDISSDPLAYGFMVAILQRTDHHVSGNGSIAYFQLSPASAPQCYAILDASADPADFGYAGASVIQETNGYGLYRNSGCD